MTCSKGRSPAEYEHSSSRAGEAKPSTCLGPTPQRILERLALDWHNALARAEYSSLERMSVNKKMEAEDLAEAVADLGERPRVATAEEALPHLSLYVDGNFANAVIPIFTEESGASDLYLRIEAEWDAESSLWFASVGNLYIR